MVSFWPFKAHDQSAESFERLLSELSTKISQTTAQQDKFRYRERKYKVLWSLYAVFTFILIVAILTLVIGWESWTWIEYVVVGGGPPFIYTIRQSLSAYYNYLIANRQDRLNDLYKQREEAIDRLKKATKYNSTQQLLEKYGGSPPAKKRQPSQQLEGKKMSQAGEQEKQAPSQPSRTGFAPPPTANIQPKQPPKPPTSPQNAPKPGPKPSSDTTAPPPGVQVSTAPNEEFALNAFSAPPRVVPSTQQGPQNPYIERKWYDRILDVMLGEDEGSSKNRIALICQNCRLVNGQAPPGARTLEDIGKWRCSACHQVNGVESEEAKILKEISTGEAASPSGPASPTTGHMPAGSDPHAEHSDDEDYADAEHEAPG